MSCGAISADVSESPVAHAICHCGNCNRRTGSAFGISAYFRKQDVTLKGEMQVDALHNAARKEDQERDFCKQCGTTLFWYVSTYPDFIGIAGGCFAGDQIGEPTINGSFSKRLLSWVTLQSGGQELE